MKNKKLLLTGLVMMLIGALLISCTAYVYDVWNQCAQKEAQAIANMPEDAPEDAVPLGLWQPWYYLTQLGPGAVFWGFIGEHRQTLLYVSAGLIGLGAVTAIIGALIRRKSNTA